MVCARYPPFVGGTEIHVAEVSAQLVRRGHHVDVITTVFDPAATGSTDEDGITVHRIPARPRRTDLHVATGIGTALERTRPDVVHVQGYHTFVAPMAMSSARRLGLPYVVTFHSGGHSSRIRKALRPVQHRILRRPLRLAERLIGVSDYETETFRRILAAPADRFVTIPNGVSDAFIEIDRPGPSESRTPIVSSIGRLEEYKGHQLVIDAFHAVHARNPAARLQIVGEGDYESELRRLVDRRGLGGVVDFVSWPFREREELARRFADSAVVALMSKYESQCVVGFEALATGTRLTVADTSALAELARFDGVEIVPLADSDALSASLIRQIDAPMLESRAAVPTWSDTADALLEVYDGVLAGSSS